MSQLQQFSDIYSSVTQCLFIINY